jgi:arsenate reductase-like glutaredoxin family protein
LRNSSVEIDEINYAKTGLTEDVVSDIIAKAGSVAAVMNTRHATVKEKGWVDKPPLAKEFAKAVVGDVNLLRRPIIIDGDRVIVGFDRDAYAKLGGAKKPAKRK